MNPQNLLEKKLWNNKKQQKCDRSYRMIWIVIFQICGVVLSLFSKIIDLKDNSDDQWILCSYGKCINSNLITAVIEALL